MLDTDLILKRGDCYKLLAACFYEPDRELFLSEHLGENLAGLLTACQCPKAAAAASVLQTALAASDPEELLVEFARLFVGPFELGAPPYGSVYFEENGRLMGDSTLAAQNLYREAGLAQEIKEAPDHIALELEFLHYLCRMAAEAVAKNNTARAEEWAGREAEFLRRLLRPWAPVFCEKIRQGTEDGFYSALADCLGNFVAEITLLPETMPAPQESTIANVCRPAV
jgi:TorA maturation chaperone TorD